MMTLMDQQEDWISHLKSLFCFSKWGVDHEILFSVWYCFQIFKSRSSSSYDDAIKKILEITNAKYAKACPPIHDKKKTKRRAEGRWENTISMAL